MVKSSYEWRKYLEEKLLKFKLYIQDPNITKQEFNLSTDLAFITLEEFFLTLSFAIRKLSETKTVSPEAFKENASVKLYQRKDHWDEPVKEFWSHYYNLNKEKSADLGLIFLCNQFIHSFIFVARECIALPYSNEKYLIKGVWFNSDKTKDRYLYYIDVLEFIKIIEKTVSNLQRINEFKLLA